MAQGGEQSFRGPSRSQRAAHTVLSVLRVGLLRKDFVFQLLQQRSSCYSKVRHSSAVFSLGRDLSRPLRNSYLSPHGRLHNATLAYFRAIGEKRLYAERLLPWDGCCRRAQGDFALPLNVNDCEDLDVSLNTSLPAKFGSLLYDTSNPAKPRLRVREFFALLRI